MTKCKRALSLLLVMLMVLALLPVSAFAAGEKETYSIVINYVFADNTQAAPPWTATVSKGSSLNQSVTSPAVVGYTPDKAVVELNYTNINEDKTVTVTYKPALVNFTVRHYLQNIDDDKYTLAKTETKKGYTEAAVGDALKDTTEYDGHGFTALLYDTTTKIAADGSTVVEIYYDRNYYLLSLDLDGGYGAEPVYARYGAPISVANPTKPGYTFAGWNPALPSTMPAKENQTHTAQWTSKDAVNYTVVFWYENADDAEYSYAGSVTQSAKAGTTVKSGDFQNTSFTGRDSDHFTYNSKKAETVTVAGDGSTVVNVYFTRNTYTLMFREKTCGKIEGWFHSHSDSCYKVYKTITAKYEQDIRSNFPIKSGDKTIWWTVPSGCESFKPGKQLGSIDTMPGENVTFTKYDEESGATIYYYVETLNGASGSYSHDGKNFELYKEIAIERSSGGILTYTEEFHNITGFTQWWSDPAFDKHEQGGKTSSIKEKNYLCYTRDSYTLSFYNYNAKVAGKDASVQYEALLNGYNFTPAYPTDLEANAYAFAGWYTAPGCFDGSEVNWDTITMPAKDLLLYAKWV